MSMTVTAERGQTFEVFTTTLAADDKYVNFNVRGVECAYVRPCGIAPDGFHIPRDLVQQLLNEEIVAVNDPPDNDDPEPLYDLMVVGETEGREELRNLRTIEERTQDDFLRRVDLKRSADGYCKKCGRMVESPGRDGVWPYGLLHHWQCAPSAIVD